MTSVWRKHSRVGSQAIVRFDGDKQPVRLFCLPYAGAAAHVFASWTAFLPNFDLCAVELPGRGGRFTEHPHNRFEPALAEVVAAVLPLLDQPYAIYGHSMGALLAFEVVRTLAGIGKPAPSALVISGARPPNARQDDREGEDEPDDEVVDRLRKLNGIPHSTLEDPDFRETFLPIIRADFGVCKTYTYRAGEPIRCPLIACGGSDDPEVAETDVENWRGFAGAGFMMRMFAGDHFFVTGASNSFRTFLGGELVRIFQDCGAFEPQQRGVKQ